MLEGRLQQPCISVTFKTCICLYCTEGASKFQPLKRCHPYFPQLNYGPHKVVGSSPTLGAICNAPPPRVQYVVLLGDSGEARVEVDDLVLGLDQSVVLARSVHVRQGHPSHLQTHPGEHKFAVQGEDLATPGVGGFGLHEPQQGTVRAAVGAAPDVGLAFGATLGGGALQMAPNVGLEPTTLRLRVSCSTD
ncbi:hypothetical protein J6590_099576 [Homalodisca vitripennis]|nr:hypothetical protein J6590_099576 [Homalodisca vitripennis]